jgi:hypothetical protein
MRKILVSLVLLGMLLGSSVVFATHNPTFSTHRVGHNPNSVRMELR